MRLIKGCIMVIVILALTAGCMPKRLPEEKGEEIPLSHVLTQTLRRYDGVSTLQAQLFIKLKPRDDYYVLKGVLLYERPARLRLRLTTSFGGTVGEVIYNEGMLVIILPTKEKIYEGWIGEGEHHALEVIVLTMAYTDYAEIEGRGFPTRIYGEVEGLEFRFDVKLKDPQVDITLPEGAFSPSTEGWEVHPLEELKDLLQGMGVEKGP